MKFPMIVKCYGRTYQARTNNEWRTLMHWLTEGNIDQAERYRVPEPHWWNCGDCGLRHRVWTEACRVSGRRRELAEAKGARGSAHGDSAKS